MSQRNQPNYIPALTGVRALAAYLVFISHFDYVFDGNFPHAVQRFLQEFHMGVTIFFVLSGFLITFRYYNNFHLTKDWFKQYLKNRIARIYPMYFLLTVLAFVYYYFTGDQKITHGFPSPLGLLIMHVTFVRGFFAQLWDTGIAQGWSLTVEECFYFSAPFIFLINKRIRVFFLQPALITAVGLLLVVIFRNVNFYGFFGNFTFTMVYTFLGRCFEFFVGIQLALIMLNRGTTRTNKIKYTYLGFLLMMVCVGIMSQLSIPQGWMAGLHNPFGILTNNYLLPPCIAMFFYGLLTESTVFKTILSFKFVELLGKSSYIFYLIHLGYIKDLLNDLLNWGNDLIFDFYDKHGLSFEHSPLENDVVNLVIQFVLLNAASILLFKMIEEPLNHYIRNSDLLIKAKPRTPNNDPSLIKN
ncbi:acyltransferase [Mucilaginibacter daejeonensis]|uniref:acyltransferase family protein n=1 Tax=Mucilaginibacter daejeonensis TaxID=398049 RepID=UPI001D17663E|nr:acyltransferase [Mucilaginibacter daejeonensis]UEG53119.1 acyltransferase [Mucilaginibacter daejeonensis]